VQWTVRGGGRLIFCPVCCRRLLTGLAADMIQCVAIADIQALTSGYHSLTLTRTSQKEADTAARAILKFTPSQVE
jgi:hypothetical protein